MAQISFIVPAGESAPEVGDSVELPVEGGSAWFELGQIVGARVRPDGVEVTLRLREGLMPTNASWHPR